MEYYLAMKKNKILPFATMLMEQESIMLSEICKTERKTLYYYLYVESKNKTKDYILKNNRNRLTDIENKLTVIRERESGRVERGVLELTDTNNYVKSK